MAETYSHAFRTPSASPQPSLPLPHTLHILPQTPVLILLIRSPCESKGDDTAVSFFVPTTYSHPALPTDKEGDPFRSEPGVQKLEADGREEVRRRAFYVVYFPGEAMGKRVNIPPPASPTHPFCPTSPLVAGVVLQKPITLAPLRALSPSQPGAAAVLLQPPPPTPVPLLTPTCTTPLAKLPKLLTRTLSAAMVSPLRRKESKKREERSVNKGVGVPGGMAEREALNREFMEVYR
ncbi:hypothetical protein BT69DRAFT_1339947 [Atractiella rhizophila]|nr:hypothetical protein BT69DRAFT_1339947 [Atractiella rhizophila]